MLRTIYGALSFSTALFVFQACYGTPRDLGRDVLIKGSVKSKETNQPIPGIKVSLQHTPQYGITDSQGRFWLYATMACSYKLRFEDADSTQSGSFLPKDTVVNAVDETTFLNVTLDAR